jgi:hypothetical protein
VFAIVGQTWAICAALVRIADCQGRSGRNSFHEQEDERRIHAILEVLPAKISFSNYPIRHMPRHSLASLISRLAEVRPEPQTLPPLSPTDKVKLQHNQDIEHLYYPSKLEARTFLPGA